MKALLLTIAALAFVGCQDETTCGQIINRDLNCTTTPCTYFLRVEWSVGDETWETVSQEQWYRDTIGMTYCR